MHSGIFFFINVANNTLFINKCVRVSIYFPNSPQRRGGELAGLGHRKCTWRHVNFHLCLKNLDKSAHDCRGGLGNSSNRAKELRIRGKSRWDPLRWTENPFNLDVLSMEVWVQSGWKLAPGEALLKGPERGSRRGVGERGLELLSQPDHVSAQHVLSTTRVPP